MNNDETNKKEGGNATIAAVLVVLVLAAVGVGAYFSGMIDMDNQAVAKSEKSSEENNATSIAALETQSGEEKAVKENSDEKRYLIEPGDPTIAKLNGTEIKRTDLYRFMQQMGPQIQGQNMQQLYPLVQEQLINNQLVSQKIAKEDFSNDETVKAQLEEARKNIERQVFLEKEIDKLLTEKRIKKEYEQYKKAFPKVEEMKASHILVDDEAKAKEAITKLNEGADFASLAKEYSKDSSAARGGELDYFAKGEVVPEFAEAAYKLKAGEYTKEPVKSQFGYHVIKAGDKRDRKPVEFEVAKVQIAQQLRPVILNEVLANWRKDAKVEKFDINGKDIEPAAGE